MKQLVMPKCTLRKKLRDYTAKNMVEGKLEITEPCQLYTRPS